MAHIPTTESYLKKVCRIAKELDISIEEAALTCDAFELAFSDDEMRQAIFGMIDQLDESAARKGEPLGLIINYSVELTMDGIKVGRYADEVPLRQALEPTPTNQAMIFLRIADDFPTQEVLGPMIVNRPELPSLGNKGLQTDVFCRADGLVCSDSEMKEPAILLGPSSLEPARQPICLGPIRLKFAERYPFVFAGPLKSRVISGIFFSDTSSACPPFGLLKPAGSASQTAQPTSGLSPIPLGESGTLRSKDVPPGPWQIDAETFVSLLDL